MLTNNACSKGSKFPRLLILAAVVMLAQDARAQNAAAPQPQGELPAQAVPARNDAPPAAAPAAPPEAQTAAAEQGEQGQAGSASLLPPDPCPAPSAEMARTPDDLAKVQADIDRYTLCMERAQLLQRLNDLALENQKRLNEASGVAAAADNPGMQLGNLPSFAEQRDEIMRTMQESVLGRASAPAQPEASSTEWVIMKIYGAGSGLSAQLGKTDGTLANVKTGDSLPDGSDVNRVTATSVEITQDGDQKTLRWVDSADLSQMSGG